MLLALVVLLRLAAAWRCLAARPSAFERGALVVVVDYPDGERVEWEGDDNSTWRDLAVVSGSRCSSKRSATISAAVGNAAESVPAATGTKSIHRRAEGLPLPWTWSTRGFLSAHHERRR